MTIATPIELMYRAAKVEIPAEAAHVMRIANDLHKSLNALDIQSSEAGDPALLVSMLHVGGDMHAVLAQAVATLDNCSLAVLSTANHFVNTDAEARSDYEGLSERLKERGIPPHPVGHPLDPEDPGYVVQDPWRPSPPNREKHRDPTEKPEPSRSHQEDRADNNRSRPGIPEIERRNRLRAGGGGRF